uniref:Uncharacterized protein n=1 Tax=Rhodosorus marinus TaxID=101924 RepID=A0A7S3E5V5_9RHOD|mmetsp:Transcript_10407/g.43255  ORF Transcript_10407/g.43255 Transcript_10407/m.43255 type:complete len:351 (+) Transcript_10407:45-1097(+)
MGQDQSRPTEPQVAPVSGERVEIRPIRGGGNTRANQQNAPPGRRVRTGAYGGPTAGGGQSLYPEVPVYQDQAPPYVSNSAHPSQGGPGNRRSSGRPILPIISHWKASPLFQLRVVPYEKSNRESLKVGVDLDFFQGRAWSFIKYKLDDIRLGIRGAPLPDSAFASLGVLGSNTNLLVLSVGYNYVRHEPFITFKVKSRDVLRARVGGGSGAAVDSPAGLDYKFSINLSTTSRVKAVGSLDLPPQGVIIGGSLRDSAHLAVNHISFKQKINKDFLLNGCVDVVKAVYNRISGSYRRPIGSDRNLYPNVQSQVGSGSSSGYQPKRETAASPSRSPMGSTTPPSQGEPRPYKY